MIIIETKDNITYNVIHPVECNNNGFLVLHYVTRENHQPVNKTRFILPTDIAKIYS